MRIAVLGGTGSIGMATAALLATRGAAVTILSRRPAPAMPEGVTWRGCDLTQASSLREALAANRIERVAHLAALLQFACEEDPAQAVRVNVDGTLNVLTACRELGIRRVVFGSSIAVYGERSDSMRETDPLPHTVNLYGMTKRLGEVLGERYRDLWGIEFVALRYSGVFGPGEAASAGMALVRQRILQCARGADVRVEGACGDEHSHLTHVDDAAEATCTALLGDAPAGALYNVAGPRQNYVSLRQLHALVGEMAPGAGRALWSGRGRTSGPVDTSRIAQDLGWRPRVALKDGLRGLLAATAFPSSLETR
jgi:UDP-glucose 4-epimerase